MISNLWRQVWDKRHRKELSSNSMRAGLTRQRGFGIQMAVAALICLSLAGPALAGGPDNQRAFKILPPVVHENLAIFPVISNQSNDTSLLMTLDEGIRSGQVTVTEAGAEPGLVRPGQQIPPRREGAEVNRLVLYNNSSHALLLLAGEIVTGGKQDRVIGSDRIVPPNAGPIDLGVFCVERRWRSQACVRRRWPSTIRVRFGPTCGIPMQRWPTISAARTLQWLREQVLTQRCLQARR